MTTGEVSQQQFTHAYLESAVDACKWIAACHPDPLERIKALRAVFELRATQREQGRAQ